MVISSMSVPLSRNMYFMHDRNGANTRFTNAQNVYRMPQKCIDSCDSVCLGTEEINYFTEHSISVD